MVRYFQSFGHHKGYGSNYQESTLPSCTPRLRNAPKRRLSNKGNCRLTDPQVLEIRKKAADGVKQADIAKEFGISEGQCSGIIKRKKWAHLP